MAQNKSFAVVRAVLKRRQQLSYKLAHSARALCASICLGAWALVCVAVLNAGPVFVPAMVAVIATLICIPLSVIANALLGAQMSTLSKVKNSRVLA
jgi:hypothetical protein